MIGWFRPDRPEAFEELRSGRTIAWTRPEARSWVERALSRGGTLYDRARSEAGGQTRLAGRAPVYMVSPGWDQWIVRHYVRGGSVASFLGDRYLRGGLPRPLAEASASERLRREGIPTPRVLAAAVYASGAFYRGDLMTEHVAASQDLARVLFEATDGRSASETPRIPALERSAALIEELSSRGFLHPDLNVKNFLVQAGPPVRVHLLDLDRCRAGSGHRLRGRMERRFRDSLRKWERRSGNPLRPEEWAAVRRAFDSSSPMAS